MSFPSFDSHCHLTDARFDADRDAVLERAREAGVREVVTVATNPGDARRGLRLAEGREGVWATAGLHPHEAAGFGPEPMEEIEALVADPRVVAVGETGLDYHYENAPRDVQLASFRTHLELAGRTAMPVIVHARDADGDTAALLREAAGVRGVLHCFTGGEELLEAGLEAGWYVSFSGIVTFASEVADRVARVPDDRLLVETDSPYLAPVPMRGRRNEPSFLPHTCRRVAELRGTDPARVAELTRANARRLYGLGGT